MGQFFVFVDIMRFKFMLCSSLIFVLLTALFGRAVAAESTFGVLPGLEAAVAFWKQIFTRYGAGDVVFFDPFDHGKIYSVLRVPDTDEGRALVERERARILANYDLNEEDGRVKTQRGVKEQFIEGLKISGRYMSQMRQSFAMRDCRWSSLISHGGVILQCARTFHRRCGRYVAVHARYREEVSSHHRYRGRATGSLVSTRAAAVS